MSDAVAVATCTSCKKDMPASVMVCPQCGLSRRGKTPVGAIVIGVVILVGVLALVGTTGGKS